MRIGLLNRSKISKEIQAGIDGLEDFLDSLPEETQKALDLTEMDDEQAHKHLPPIFRYMRESLARIFIDATGLSADEEAFVFIPGVNVDAEPESPQIFPPNDLMLDVDKLAGYIDGTIEIDAAEDIERINGKPSTSPTVADLLSFAVVDQRLADEVSAALRDKHIEGLEIAKAQEEARRESMAQTIKALAAMSGMNTLPVMASRSFEWPKRPTKRERSEAEMEERRARKKANKEKRRARRKKLRR